MSTQLQQVTSEQAAEKLGTRPDDLEYYAWPELFGSTAGPFGGIGGQAMTTFTIEAWVDGVRAVIFCRNRILFVTDGFVTANYHACAERKLK